MKTLDSPALLDTNVLVYSLFEKTEHHQASRRLLTHALEGNRLLFYVTTQILGEFYAVVTNPKRVEHARSPGDTLAAIQSLLSLPGLDLLSLGRGHALKWTSLATHHSVSGGAIFDLHHVASMLLNNVGTIYTFNTDDFQPFQDLIEVRTPDELI